MSDIRFIHTADWQIGKPFNNFNPVARTLMERDRIEVIERIANYANSQNVHFTIVAGDIFETADVPRELVNLVCKKLELFEKPVLLLTGNHEYSSHEWILEAPHFVNKIDPKKVIVLKSGVNEVPGLNLPGLEIIGAPPKSKEDKEDRVANEISKIGSDKAVRILVGHGRVDGVAYDSKDNSKISRAAMDSAINEKKVHYFALGDRHSRLAIGDSQRIWYSGAPEPTSFREPKDEQRLILDITLSSDGETISVKEKQVGSWTFMSIGTPERQASISSIEELESLIRKETSDLDAQRTAIEINLAGTLPAPDILKAERLIQEWHKSKFGMLQIGKQSQGFAPLIESESEVIDRYGLSGYLLDAYRELVKRADGEGASAKEAKIAISKMLGILEVNR